MPLKLIEVWQTHLGETRQADIALARRVVADGSAEIATKRCGSVVRMQVDEIAKLAVDDPLYEAVAILEFDSEDSVRVVHRVDTVGDAETEMVEQDGDATSLGLIALHGHLEEEDGKNAGL